MACLIQCCFQSNPTAVRIRCDCCRSSHGPSFSETLQRPEVGTVVCVLCLSHVPNIAAGVERELPVVPVVAVPAKSAAVSKQPPREVVSRQQAVAMSQERRNAGRRSRMGADGIDPMDPVNSPPPPPPHPQLPMGDQFMSCHKRRISSLCTTLRKAATISEASDRRLLESTVHNEAHEISKWCQ